MAGEIRVPAETLQAEKSSQSITSDSCNDDRSEVLTDMKDKQLVAAIKQLVAVIKGEEKDKYEVDEDRLSREKKEKFQKIIRENKDLKKYYQPREFSVGPINADTCTLFNKKLKHRLTQKFIKDSGKQADSLLGAIKNNIESLKTCFGKEMLPLEGKYRLDDAELARLLFLDGCAVLQFIHGYACGNLREFGITNIQEALIRQDLFLFENQIPFAVFMLLMKLIDDNKKKELSKTYSYAIQEFVRRNNICDSTFYDFFLSFFFSENRKIFEKIKPLHLLDLLRLVSIYGDVDKVEDIDEPEPHSPEQRMGDHYGEQYFRNVPEIKLSFRNVQELKLSGIKVKRSKFPSLRSVSFSTHWFGISGHLELPVMIVNHSTVSKLLNLVAYETWVDDVDKQRVSSYLEFMDLLIDTEGDAKDLRIARVLRNRLSTDADAANVFNKMGSAYLSMGPDYYLKVKAKIQKHYKRNRAIWLAEFYNSHFRSPLTTVAFILAAIVLVLQVVQTIFTINPKN